MSSSAQELAALKFFDELTTHLKGVRDPQKALRHALRDTREFFAGTRSCIATLQAGRATADLWFSAPKDASWDMDVLTRYIRHTYPPIERTMLIATLRRRGEAWGAMALTRSGPEYMREDRQLMARVGVLVSDTIHRLDRDQLLEVRDRIDRKMMEELLPKDLFYQILAGIRTLTQYDHSSALLIREENSDTLRLVAEQIAWTKAKSRRIGLKLPITASVAATLQSEQVYGFDRHGDSWQGWTAGAPTELALLLDYNVGHPAGDEAGPDGVDPRESSMLCAPLVTRDGLVGVLKIAACNRGQLRPYDAALVEHFRAHAAIAIQNLHRTESLRARVLMAERKHAMADLARSVSHDVNNALGSMLPLVQQMQEDLRVGTMDAAVLADDLLQVQKSLQVCRRIFGGMLSFAREGARRTDYGQVARAVETASAILKHGMARSGIELTVDVADELPAVACSQGDLEQLFLNLLTNAREATPQGGRIALIVRPMAGIVEISISDTGCGIPQELMPRVLEPFFTTKPHGNGLGLSICRTVLWEVDGTISIESHTGTGTKVIVGIPSAVVPRDLQTV
jgi:signal transduction histidine kinase